MAKITTVVNVMDMVLEVIRTSKQFQATTLRQVEAVVKDADDFRIVRKIILDCINNYTRSILKIIFGDDFENNKEV